MKNKILLLSCCLCWSWMACSPTGEQNKPNGRAAMAPQKPDPTLAFDYLLYNNDYNAVPVDEDPVYYTNEVLDSALIGMAYKLTNQREYAPGLFAKVGPAAKATWYHLTMRALKLSTDMQDPLSARGRIVFSWERAGQITHYKTYPIKELLEQQNRQIIDKWETVEVWQAVPNGLQDGDVLKVYVWNPEGGTLYVDDFAVTAWTKPTLPVANANKKMRLIVEQSYEHEEPSLSITNKHAQRGSYSNAIGNLADYNAYGKTYTTSLQDQQLTGGDALRIRFAALKQDKFLRSDHVALMVCSVERAGESIYWESWSITSRLWKEGKQLTNEWKQLEWWQVLPEEAQPTDVLKIYVWNNYGTLIYIDDVSVEVVDKTTDSAQ